MTKRFRLSFVNAAEDVPRVIRAYGRACGGEFALVLRPTESTGILVHVSKQGAVQWTPRDGRDAPAFPEEATTSEDAVAAVKEAQKRPGRQGPITLRGQWSGYLHCDGNVPVVELRRKLATYAVLTIASRPEEGVWAWKVERLERWFGGPGQDTGEAPSLLLAVEAGLASAMGLLGQVCGQRDSRRRGAYDTGWAEKYPVKPAKEGRDPTQRLKPRRRRARKKTASKAGKTSVGPASKDETTTAKGASPKAASSKAAARSKRATSEVSTTSTRRAPTKRATEDSPSRTSTKRTSRASRKGRARPASSTKPTTHRTSAKTKTLDDAAADKALLDAFKDAVSSALSEVP